MPSASSVVDHFEAAALKDEFDAAVEHLTQLTMASTTLDGPELTEAVERRLFSLHARVTRGVPPAEPPAKADEAEQWAAWDETRAMSAEAAQQEYIDLVRRHTAGFDALDELDGDDVEEETELQVNKVVEELAGDLFKGQTDAPETLPEQQAAEPAEADDDLDTMKARLQAL